MKDNFVSKRIYELRNKKNISGRKLSLELGLSNSYITQIENGQRMPSLENLSKICDYFGISLAEFFCNNLATANITKEQKELLKAINKLSPCQISAIKSVIKAMTYKD